MRIRVTISGMMEVMKGDEAADGAGHQAHAAGVGGDAVLDLRRAGAAHGHGGTAEADAADDQAAGGVVVAEDLQGDGEHGEADHEGGDAAVGQHQAGDGHCQQGALLAEGLDDAVGDGFCCAGDQRALAHHGAGHEHEEVAGDEAREAADVGGDEGLVDIKAARQRDDENEQERVEVDVQALEGKEHQTGQAKYDAQQTDRRD